MERRTALGLLCCLLVARVGATRSQGHDALEEDSEDAAAYEKYMSATEASAPLMRHGAPGGHPHGYKNVFRSVAGHATLTHSTDVEAMAASKGGRVPPPATMPRRRLVHVWSPWSAWSTCSRTCGGGITSRHRTCRLEYARVSEGSGIRLSYHQCIGESSEYSMCNPQPCSPLVANSHPEDFRQFQCSLYNNRTIRGHYVASWTPFNLGPNQCELSCRAGNKPNGIVYSFGKVLDGTRCTTDPEVPYKDFCINGRCQTVGCDGRVGSRAKRDMCHVCGGTNSTCQKVASVAFPSGDHLPKSRTAHRSTMIETYGYGSVVRIPRGATNVRITDNSTSYLALMDERERYFINGNWVIDWPGRYESAGVAFHYERTRDAEVIRATGPLQQDLIVMALLREKNPAVYYEYWVPRQLSHHQADALDAYVSDARQLVQAARPTTKPTTMKTTTVTTTTTPKPTTTTTAPTTESPEELEAQPTAASLVRSPPRTYRGFFFPFFSATTTSTPPTTTTPSTVAPRSGKQKRLSKKQRDEATRLNEVREHLGIVHGKKHSKASSVRSAVLPPHGQKLGCSVDGSCWKTVNGKKHFCLSEFVLRCKVLNYDVINGETRYEVEILQSYKNTIPILSREFIWAEPVPDCPCASPYLRPGTDYIIMGKTDGKFRRNEIRLLLDRDSYVRVYNQANADRVLRIRRDEAKYCQKYKTEFNLTY